jgi:hypothetical protein
VKIIRILVLPLLLAVHGLAAGGIDRGDAAYKQGDYGTALREWRPLAERGNPGAQLNLGFMYDNGYGVPQDVVRAHMWYDIAGVDVAINYRDYVAREMTPEQIAEAQKLAREWLGKHP